MKFYIILLRNGNVFDVTSYAESEHQEYQDCLQRRIDYYKHYPEVEVQSGYF